MSFDLSTLRFQVDTKQLDDAITKVGNLATSVVALNKPLSKLGSDSKATAGDIDTTTKAVNTNTQAVKTNQSILERQEAILNKLIEGWSKGQSSILVSAKASGIANTEMQKLESTLASQRKLLGNDPFDKSASGLTSLTQGLGAAREGYRQMLKFQEEFNRLQKEGKGEELRLVSLNKKETDSLYRDKQRMIEQYKILKSASFDASNTEMIDKQKNAYKDLVQNVKNLEATYKQVATAKRPLDNLRTVDSTKRRDELNYLARATSVQLGDVGISLAGGQNPLTVFLQQGDQLRGVFNQVGASGTEMKEALSKAFSQIVVGFVEVGKVMGTFVVGAIADASKAIVKFTLDSLGVTTVLGYLRERLVAVAGESSTFVRAFDKIGSIASGAITTGVLGLTTVLIGLAVAYAKILPVQQELNAALLQNGASLATSSKDAMQFAATMSSVSGTSLDYAKVITEIATAGNLSKESIEGITISAIEMNRYLGVATKDVVAQYSKLADDPVKALTEIGTATGRVTAETIDHIRELVEQGKKTEAVSEANRELDRAYAEMSASARDSMTPLGKLWDDMKGSINELIEAVYAFAQTDGAINVLSTVWQTLKVAISEVLFVIRGVGRELGGLAAQGAAIAKGDFTGAGRIGDMMKSDAEEARKAQDAYTASIIKGADARKVASQIELNGLKVNRDQIKARAEIEKLEDKFGTKSVLTATQRLKKISDAKAQVDEQLAKSGLSVKDAELKRRPLYANIEESFKDKKKGSGGAAAIRDSISAEQKQIENDRAIAERKAKASVEVLEHLHNLELVNDREFITKKAELQTAALEKSIDFLKREQKIASTKVNSLKEVEGFNGKIAKVQDDISKLEIKRKQDILELETKIGKQKYENLIAELTAIADLNKSYDQQRKNGLQDNAERKAELDFRESLVGKSDKQKEQMTLLFEEESRLRKIARQETEDLRKAQEDYNKAIEGAKSGTAAIEAVRAFDATKAGITSVADGQRANVKQGTDIKVQEIEIRVTGLDKLSEAFSGLDTLIGNFGSMAQANVDNITVSIGRMGDSYKGQFKGMLKDAQAQAAGYGRLQKSVGGIATSLKTLSEADKKYTAGSKEHVQAQVGGYAEMAGAAAEYFEKGSTGYDVLKAAEQGFRAFELAMSIQSMVQKTVEASTKVSANGAIAASGVMAGAGEMFAALGPFGFPAVAAMLAVMASLGFGGGGSSATFGTAGVGNQIGADGRKVSSSSPADNEPSNYDPSTGTYSKQNKPQKTEQEMIDFANAAAIDAAANAVANLKIEAMKLTKGSEELEQSLARARLAAGGMGKAQHELATQGMNEAELASYNYNQALRGQIAVQMDIANGTDLTSDNMKSLAKESRSLAIELMMASGDIAGARAMQRDDDTAGFTAQEVAMYDHNQAMRDQIDAMNASASAAREAAQAEEQLANTRYELAGRLNILLGRQSQVEYDRATELAGTTDAASLEMLNLIYKIEDLTAAVDSQYATLERSIEAERKLAEARLTSATALQGVLKTAKGATTTLMTRGNAQLSLTRLLAIAKATGVLPSADAMRPLLDALTAPSEDLFSTFEDYQRDFLKTAYNITEMANLADDQVSLEQKTLDKLDAQLEQAKAQLDALKGVDTSVKDVATAIKDFDEAMRALGNAKSSTGTYNYSAPVTGGSGGSSGGGSSGSGASNGQPTFEDIAGQENKDIVAAYREYYNRNPDESGYKNFLDSKLTGDKLMQAILGASAIAPDSADFKTAVSKGYDPLTPLAKFYKPKAYTAGGNGEIPEFDVGINRVPYDMYAKVHKDERILPAADNRELFARLQNPQDNAVVMAAAITRLTDEVKLLRAEQRQTVINTGKTAESFKYMTNGNGTALNVVIET